MRVFEVAPPPTAFTARIATLYVRPLVRPGMSNGEAVPDALRHSPPSSWYWYPVTADPPVDVGAVKAAWMNWLPTVRPVRFGALGAANGVADARELTGPVPAAFSAATRNT